MLLLQEKQESEIILRYNTKYQIIDANVIKEFVRGVFCNVIQIEIMILNNSLQDNSDDEDDDDYCTRINQRSQPLRFEDFI